VELAKVTAAFPVKGHCTNFQLTVDPVSLFVPVFEAKFPPQPALPQLNTL